MQPPRATPDSVTRRKAILRSKSDVGPSRFAPDLLPAVPPEFTGDVPVDLDRFFDTIGNQEAIFRQDALETPRSGRSSPVYFPSVSSVDSCCRRRNADNAYESSDSDDLAATLQRRLLGNAILKDVIKYLLDQFELVCREPTGNGRAVDRRAQRSHHQMAHQMPERARLSGRDPRLGIDRALGETRRCASAPPLAAQQHPHYQTVARLLLRAKHTTLVISFRSSSFRVCLHPLSFECILVTALLLPGPTIEIKC